MLIRYYHYFISYESDFDYIGERFNPELSESFLLVWGQIFLL